MYLDEKNMAQNMRLWSGVTIKAENLTSFKENLWNFIDYVQRWKFSYGMCFSPVNPHGLRKEESQKSSKDGKFHETVAATSSSQYFFSDYQFRIYSADKIVILAPHDRLLGTPCDSVDFKLEPLQHGYGKKFANAKRRLQVFLN